MIVSEKVSVPSFVIGGLQGSTATSGSCEFQFLNIKADVFILVYTVHKHRLHGETKDQHACGTHKGR